MVIYVEKYSRTGSASEIREYLMDTDAEVSDLPQAPAGSYAISAESGKVFYCGNDRQWK